jgi:hypothetical protein
LLTDQVCHFVARLKIVDDKIWLSVKYQSCIGVKVDVCGAFYCYNYLCGFKDIKNSSSAAAVLVISYVVVFVGYWVGV